MAENNSLTKPRMTFGDVLRCSPYAYAKLIWMRDRGNTEVAGCGITGTDDPLLITDFRLVRSWCTGIHFDMDTEDLVDHQDVMLDEGIMVWQSARILAHTHPCSPKPSGDDEINFQRSFSKSDWAIMLILGTNDSAYCRLKINIGPGVTKELKLVVDWSIPFEGSNSEAWEAEYQAKVIRAEKRKTPKSNDKTVVLSGLDDGNLWDNEFEEWQSSQRNCPIDNIDDDWDLDCHWESDCVVYWSDEDEIWYYYDPYENKWYKDMSPDSEVVVETDNPNTVWAPRMVQWAKYNVGDEGRHSERPTVV